MQVQFGWKGGSGSVPTKESEELALTLTVEEGDFKVNDVAPRATSEEDISSGDSFVFTGAVSG